ncbi:MAG: S8 family serine peptidase [Planctomycetota bacterium]
MTVDGGGQKTKNVILLNLAMLILVAASPPAAADAPADPYVPNELIVKFRGNVVDSLHEQLKSGTSPEALSLSVDLDRLNARYRSRQIKPLCKDFRKKRQQLKALRTKSKALLTENERRILRRLRRAPKAASVPDLAGIYKIRLDLEPGHTLEQAIEEYRALPDVEYAEFNYIVSVCAAPNDPFFPVQWPLHNTAQIYPESGKFDPPPGKPDIDIDAPEAWDIVTGSSRTIVAVVDTGVDYTHRDLDDNMWVNEAELNGDPGVDDDGNGYVDDIYGYDFINGDRDPIDDHGHGTHCAGIIAAEGDNDLDIAGVCWDARIMAVKFMGADGHGDIADAVEGLYYAVENGADVLSNSWTGFTFFIKPLEDALDYAQSQGVIAVASAGNLNSTDLLLPAYFDNVISVAATDSRDHKPTFSNYGEQVDIAAPGVDVLSLRAAGTSMGTPYNAYLTIASGTSMACPHVSGAFALMLSLYPGIDIDDARDIVMQTTDQIHPDICKSGRLNLYEAISVVATFYAGDVRLDRYVYSCSDTIEIFLQDLNLVGQGTQTVNLSAGGGDSETVILTEFESSPGDFSGTISTEFGDPNVEDGTLQLSHRQIITVTYEDADDGTGNPAVVTDQGLADCEPPVIRNLNIDPLGPDPTVTFETNEPAIGSVLCGPVCGGPYSIEKSDPDFDGDHTIKLTGVLPCTDYFFIVQAVDIAGNNTVDDNAGLCYAFTTNGPGDMFVPSRHPNIQTAIDKAWDGSTVWVANGVYTGHGNRDVDFKARAITVRSEDGPARCIIDCQGSMNDPHYGFYFHSGETESSVLSGFTIANARTGTVFHGGAITCLESSPTILNCVIKTNEAPYGGGIACKKSSPRIADCTITGNKATNGGGISCQYSSPTITSCLVTGNQARLGGGLHSRKGAARILSSTFAGNLAGAGSGIMGWQSKETVKDCIIWGNFPSDARQFYSSQTPTYSCLQNYPWSGHGNIDADPCFLSPGYWADANGSGILAQLSVPNVVWVEGDYHLRPDSPCINAADPNYDSQPDQTDIDDEPRVFNGRLDMGADEFVPVTEVRMRFTPHALAPGSEGKWIKAHLLLPQGFIQEDVDINTPAKLKFLNLDVESEFIDVFLNEDALVEVEIGFDRSIFCGAGSAEAAVRVTGLFTDGEYFRGTATIKIVNRTFERLAGFAYCWLRTDCSAPHWCDGFDVNRDSAVNFVDFAALGCANEIITQ